MIKVIQNYDLNDITDSLNYLLEKASLEPKVRQLALEITNSKPDSIAAIYDWVKDNVKYVPDPIDKELFISPVRMVEGYYQGEVLAGDCDDMALLTTALYRSIGISSKIILLDIRGGGLEHAVTQVSINGTEIMIDPSSDSPLGWEISYKEKVIV